jgi:hypothetical protein
MHQVRVAQVEERTATAIISEAVPHESLRRIQDQRMQEWTNSGTPVPAIGEAQVLLWTPLVGWGGTIETPPAPPVVTEPPAATAEAAAHPQENGNPTERMTMSCSSHWKCTQPQKMARLTSSLPQLP